MKYIILKAILLLQCLAVYAQQREVGEDSLGGLIQEALRNNPLIQSLEQRERAMSQRVWQVSSLDDPVLGYTRWSSSIETRVGPQQNVFMLSQRLPFFGKLRLKGHMAKQDVEVAQQAYEIVRRDVAYEVKVAYFDLFWIDQSLDILEEYHRLLQSFQEVATRKYATGAGIQANVLKARVEISSIEERRLSFAKMREGAVARLKALLGREGKTQIGAVSTIDTTLYTLSEQELLRNAMDARQELQAAQAMIKRADFGIQLAKRNYWPDLTLSAAYITIPGGRTVVPDDGKDPWSIQASINLPMWFGKRKAAVEEARAARNANRMSYKNLKNEVEAEIRDLYARLKAAEQTVSLYRIQLIPDAERTLGSSLSSYQTGTLDFLSLLDSERMLLQFRLAYIKELANYRQQIAGLQRAVGREFL